MKTADSLETEVPSPNDVPCIEAHRSAIQRLSGRLRQLQAIRRQRDTIAIRDTAEEEVTIR